MLKADKSFRALSVLRAIWGRVFTVQSGSTDRDSLRHQLAGRLALLVIAASGLALWRLLIVEPFPIVSFILLAIAFGWGLGICWLVSLHPNLARHLLVWGLMALLLVAMALIVDPWLPLVLGPLLIFVSAMLISRAEIITGGLIAATAIWLARDGLLPQPVWPVLAALVLSMALAWLVVGALYTMLQWAWNAQQQADHLLHEARDNRAELSRTLKSLQMSLGILDRTQRDLVIARKQAEEAWRMKEQFAANISHELRTPLNLILGFSEVMHLSPEVYGALHWPPTLRRDVYHVYHSSRHLLEMIDDILDLSRFEMAGFTLNLEPTPLEPFLHGAVEIAEDLFRGCPVRLEVAIAPDLPVLEIDRTRIRQVLLNLLTNARRYTEKGVVRLEAWRDEDSVAISVSDTGPGILADKLPYIFDEFYQVDLSLRRSHGGVGLGLAISKRFVEAHQGRIQVESHAGVGSTFTFTLPMPDERKTALYRYSGDPKDSAKRDVHPHLLVVDPDPAVVNLVRRHIEDYEVVHVEDVHRLAEAVVTYRPRAIVYNVPPTKQTNDGAIPSMPVPVIECSLPSQKWVADDWSVVAFLTKPITAQQLMREIGRLAGVRDVLVIDDDRGFGQLVERILQASGRDYRVRHAYDGEQGLSAMRARRPDLVLLDLIMPGMDGFSLREEMRRDRALVDVPVVLLTATNYVEDALAQGDSRVVIRYPARLHSAGVLRCLRAVINTFEPHHDQTLTQESLSESPMPHDGLEFEVAALQSSYAGPRFDFP